MLEDLHWADDATLDFLALLGRRVGRLPALVLASFRDDELPSLEALRGVLGELATAPRVSRLASRRSHCRRSRRWRDPGASTPARCSA